MFPLRRSANDLTSGARGYLEVKLALETAEFVLPPAIARLPPTPVLRVTVQRAKGLAAADASGASDPYAVVYFNDEEVGATCIFTGADSRVL